MAINELMKVDLPVSLIVVENFSCLYIQVHMTL